MTAALIFSFFSNDDDDGDNFGWFTLSKKISFELYRCEGNHEKKRCHQICSNGKTSKNVSPQSVVPQIEIIGLNLVLEDLTASFK